MELIIKKRTQVVLLIVFMAVSVSKISKAQTADYLNPNLAVEQRVEDLVSRMTLEEKVSQMLDQAPAIDRLGVHAYNWWNEALHGVARSGLATSYPQAIGFAATWNEELVFDMATAISDEARAKHHEYARQGTYHRYQGLTIWSPNINIFRDPRWGRGQETYGEDPFLTGRIAVNFIKGLQGDDPKYFKTIATVKHFAVHNGPEPLRHTFDAISSERDLRETYLPMFDVGINEGGAYSLMCAYNRVDGVPACSSEELMVDILRDEWAFDGFVVSDCWALDDIYKNHKVVETVSEAAAEALLAGTDLECGTNVYPHLLDAVENGYITENDIDVSLKRLFTARFKLGMFDPPSMVSYQNIPIEVVDSEEHKELARRVSRESMVLLKNDGTLPFSKNVKKIAVLGPNADQEMVLLGNYNGIPSDIITPLEGIKATVSNQTEVMYSLGTELVAGYPMLELLKGEVLTTESGETGLTMSLAKNEQAEPVMTKLVSSIGEEWGENVPFEGLEADSFMAEWSGLLTPKTSGKYKFQISSTMKYELFIDGNEVLNSESSWGNEFDFPTPKTSEEVELKAGTSYSIKITAQDTKGDAQMYLEWAQPASHLKNEALEMAQQADAVVLVMGLTPRLEGEEMPVNLEGFNGGDRTSIELPKIQQDFIKEVTELGKPTALVLLNGSALALPWADEHVPAILEAWYGGQAGGTAIADVLFGEYNPAGRLPVTFNKSTDDLPPFEDYDMTNRTYRFFEGEALYPFGHGLSFTTFEYGNIELSDYSLSDNEDVEVQLGITNTGDVAGDEVVQLYVSFPESGITRPIRDLRGFDRIHLKPGETKTIEFTLSADDLKFWNPDLDVWELEKTPVLIQAGASSADIRQTKTLRID